MAARISGVIIPMQKHIVVGLTAIYGIGQNRAKALCATTKIDPAKKVKDLTESELEGLRSEISKIRVEGDLRREVAMSIKRLVELGTYRGVRHKRGLPVLASAQEQMLALEKASAKA